MYEKAWWDNSAKSWVDEQFHVLDNVTLFDRERWRTSSRAGKMSKGERTGPRTERPPLPLSSFRWNEVIFQGDRQDRIHLRHGPLRASPC